jgi:large subunit ribosomal protein L21
MFAVVEISGKQYKVKVNDIIEVDRLKDEAGKTVSFEHVMLVSDEKNTTIGTPYLEKFPVKAKIIDHIQGDKIHVGRYKQKVRYRKTIGFRAQLSKIQILAIG